MLPADYSKTPLGKQQESSAKLTNQRVSYAFTSSPFSFHTCHILPASKFQYSYSCILLILYRRQRTACMRNENCECEYTQIKSSQIFLETRMFRLSDGEEIITLAFFILIQYRSVTDGRTDGHSSSGYTSGFHSSLC